MKLTKEGWRKYFNKSADLKITGGNDLVETENDNIWFWRDDELSLKQFQLLPLEEKNQYFDFLLTLGFENLSTNDEAIVLQFASNFDDKSNMKPASSFFNFGDINAKIDSIMNFNKKK